MQQSCQRIHKKVIQTLTVLAFLLTPISSASAAGNLSVTVPLPGGQATASSTDSNISSQENDFLGFIKFINKYLRIVFVVVALAVLVYIGLKLMSGSGENTFKDLWRTLLGIVGGLLLAIFAYAIIRVLANLF